MNIKFDNKIIVVTGGSNGIGNDIVTALLSSGATVAVISRSAEKLSPKERLHLFNCDVGNYQQVKNVFNEINDKLGTIHGLINNAGICPSRNNVTETSEEDWNITINVNLSGAFYCSQFAIESMKTGNNGGVIIMISSIAAINGLAKRAAYSASKAGLAGLMRSIATDYSHEKIRSYCICPGYIRTKLTTPYINSLEKNEYDELLGKHKLGRLGETSDVSNLSLFLLSENANWMTGMEIPVDGGYSV